MEPNGKDRPSAPALPIGVPIGKPGAPGEMRLEFRHVMALRGQSPASPKVPKSQLALMLLFVFAAYVAVSEWPAVPRIMVKPAALFVGMTAYAIVRLAVSGARAALRRASSRN